MGKTLEDYRSELEQINNEEQLFGWETSQFPMLQQLFVYKDPYDKLWTTYQTFQNKDAIWLKGIVLLKV